MSNPVFIGFAALRSKVNRSFIIVGRALPAMNLRTENPFMVKQTLALGKSFGGAG
jgi:hypothetical protein